MHVHVHFFCEYSSFASTVLLGFICFPQAILSWVWPSLYTFVIFLPRLLLECGCVLHGVPFGK